MNEYAYSITQQVNRETRNRQEIVDAAGEQDTKAWMLARLAEHNNDWLMAWCVLGVGTVTQWRQARYGRWEWLNG